MNHDEVLCEGCGNEIPDSAPSYPCAEGGSLCKSCSPTYQDLLNHPGHFMNPDDEPMTADEAKTIADAHIHRGGSLADHMAL